MVAVLLSTIFCKSLTFRLIGVPSMSQSESFPIKTRAPTTTIIIIIRTTKDCLTASSLICPAHFKTSVQTEDIISYPVSAHSRSSNSAKVNSVPCTHTYGQGFNILISLTLHRQVLGITQISNCSKFSIVCPSIRKRSHSVVFLFSYSRLSNVSFFLRRCADLSG